VCVCVCVHVCVCVCRMILITIADCLAEEYQPTGLYYAVCSL